jgi:tellurite methyltransferase
MNPKDYNARFGLNPPHSEVVEACRTVKAGKALDMGCSAGRNALYLGQLGFDVTAIDNNPNAIGTLQSIIAQEQIGNIEARVYDISEARLNDSYDFIACTVTLMFIPPTRIDLVIADMQECTRAGGYNLIVAAMSTTAFPCQVNFPFTFGSGQLRRFYEGWERLKYNEDPGTMHNGMRLQFATLLACKPA